MSSHQRQTERFDIPLSIEVQHGEISVLGQTVNISLGGARITAALDPAPSVGTRVRVRFVVPDLADAIEAEALVRWVKGTDLGVQFLTGFRAQQTWALGRLLHGAQTG